MTQKKSPPEADERPQIDKFKETAKKVETDDSVETFDRALKKIGSTKKSERKPA